MLEPINFVKEENFPNDPFPDFEISMAKLEVLEFSFFFFVKWQDVVIMTYPSPHHFVFHQIVSSEVPVFQNNWGS